MRTAASIAVGLFLGGIVASDCAALHVTLLPPIPILPNRLGTVPGSLGATLGTSVQGSITITDPVPVGNRVNFAFDSYSQPLAYAYQADERESSDNRAVIAGTTDGSIASTAFASPGKLRAFASAGGKGGSVDGVATATALFVDTVTLGMDGGFTIDWSVDAQLGGGYSILTPDVRPLVRPGASASVRAQVWWVPAGVNLAQAAQSSFLGSFYQSTSMVYNVAKDKTDVTFNTIRPDLGAGDSAIDINEPLGTKFWVVGLLEVSAARGSGSAISVYPSTEATGFADAMHTVTLTVQSVRAPGEAGTVRSFSGHDYAPVAVPEPPAIALLVGGGVALLARRRILCRPDAPGPVQGGRRVPAA